MNPPNSMPRSATLIRISLAVGVLALLASVIGALHDAGSFFKNYLFSFLFWLDLPLGALALALVYPLTGGRWGAAARKILEALASTIGLLAVFCIPVLAGVGQIYPWMDPKIAAEPKVLHKHLYLNPTSFTARAVLYFGAWIALSFFLRRYSGGSVRGASPEAQAKLKRLCAGGLVLLGFTLSFAAVDWQMSVEPTWYSTVYGMIFGSSQALTAYAAALMVFGVAASRRFAPDFFPKNTLRDLGSILMMLTMIWAYLSFMQYLIVWSGNLPHEVIWYNHRTQGGWAWLALALALFQFAAPFILLLFRASKDQPRRLAYVGALVFGVRMVDHYWQVMPGLSPAHILLQWQAVTTWLGIGGIWLALFLRNLSRGPVFAESDPAWPHTHEVPTHA